MTALWLLHHATHLATVVVSVVALIILISGIDHQYIRRQVRKHVLLRNVLIGCFIGLLILNLLAVFDDEHSPLSAMLSFVDVALPTVLIFVAIHLRTRKTDVRPSQYTVMVVGAHPDDIELAAGGTVARMADARHRVHTVVMSQGQVGGDKAVRVAEARRGSEFLGASSITVLDFPDTKLADSGPEMVKEIEAVINECKPDLILTHSGHDQHQDHHAVHLATLRAARRHHSILCFESPSATRDFNPSVFIDIEDYVDAKVAAVGMHVNQAGKPYMSAHRVKGVAAFRGQQARLKDAEAFEPVRLLHSGIGALD